MKNFITIAGVILGLWFMACNKSSVTPPVVPPHVPDSTVIMYASIDTVVWEADSVSGLFIPRGNDSGHYNLAITAKKGGGTGSSVIYFYISDYTGIGSYSISPPLVSATYYRGQERHYALSGEISITNDSTANLTGVFNFVADSADGMNVENGFFRFPL